MNIQNIVDFNMFNVFIFVLIVSANFLAEVFPCRLQNLLRNNMLMKHLFGIFTMIFFVVLSNNNSTNTNIFNLIFNSSLLYILFILISKCDVYFFYIILLLLGIAYIINILKQQEMNKNEKGSEKEQKHKFQSKINIYNNITSVLYVLIIIITFIGVILYMGEKKIEYKKKFSYISFFIGKPSCKNISPSTNFSNALKFAFT
jgi:ascorbate-specific PTS system EIIC-type component UlaA